jgi:hypothetical protein
MGCMVGEAIEIELQPCTIIREHGFCLSKSCKLLIGPVKTFGTWSRSTWPCSPHAMKSSFAVWSFNIPNTLPHAIYLTATILPKCSPEISVLTRAT